MNVQIFALFAFLAVATVMAKHPDFRCPEEDGEDAVYFADKRNCRNFFQCSNGVAYLFECAEGTAWDNKNKACDWQGEDGCVPVVVEEAEKVEEAIKEVEEVAAELELEVAAAILPRTA